LFVSFLFIFEKKFQILGGKKGSKGESGKGKKKKGGGGEAATWSFPFVFFLVDIKKRRGGKNEEEGRRGERGEGEGEKPPPGITSLIFFLATEGEESGKEKEERRGRGALAIRHLLYLQWLDEGREEKEKK